MKKFVIIITTILAASAALAKAGVVWNPYPFPPSRLRWDYSVKTEKAPVGTEKVQIAEERAQAVKENALKVAQERLNALILAGGPDDVISLAESNLKEAEQALGSATATPAAVAQK